MNDFRKALAFGQEGEHMIAAWLMRRGVTVMPLYQFDGHDSAPMLYRASGSTTCPDLTCFGGRGVFFAEVKRKRRWTRHRERIETGCDLRLWHHYCAVSESTACPVFLFFLHDSGARPGLYFQSTASLAPHIREWDGCHDVTRERFSKPLALFPDTALRRVPLSEVL